MLKICVYSRLSAFLSCTSSNPGYSDSENTTPLDYSQDYHNTTVSEVNTLENTLSHSQPFSIILG
jgi:hypothetical protein